MEPANLILLLGLLTHFAKCTDLVISYKGDLKLLKDAESAKISSISFGHLPLPQKFGFPMALYYIQNGRQVLLSDYDNTVIDIYSITLDGQNNINPIVKSTKTSQIESIIYDPLMEKLYWSDVFKYGIYTHSTLNSTSQVLYETSRMEPRSIALDSCKQVLYWSDRDKSNPKISTFNLETKSHEIFQSSIGDTFYHGITFDSYDNQLWWFETNGDESSKSSCNVMKKTEFGSSVYATIDHCYPFAITFDQNYLYWSDWGKEAIVRLSKKDPSDFIELWYTPIEGKLRAFGITNVNRTDHFDCDGSFLPDNKEVSVHSIHNFMKYGKSVVHSTNIESQPERIAFTIFPDQYTSISEMKMMYNMLHRVELLFFILILIFTSISLFVMIKLYAKYVHVLKNYPHSKLIDVEALPPFEETKSTRKYKKFVPRIIVSPNLRNNNSADIENCCQMTLCDQPCDLAMKKVSCFSVKQKKTEEKLKLLDDSMA